MRRGYLLLIRGCDETYDDTHCAVDLDIDLRLQKAGLVLLLDKGNDLLVPNPRPLMPHGLRWTTSPEEALREWTEIRAPQVLSGDLHARRSILP